MPKQKPKTIKPKSDENPLGISYFDVDEVIELEKNFKNHDVARIAQSIQTHGLIDPIGLDELTKENFDGNGTVEAIRYLKQTEAPPPQGIIARKGSWYVPVLTGVSFDDDDDRIAAAAALNRLNELGGVDEALQAEIIEHLREADKLAGTGYDDADIERLLKQFETGGEGDAGDGKPKVTVSGKTAAVAQPKISNIKQTQLLFSQAEHAEFIRLVADVGMYLETKTMQDTILEALRRIDEESRNIANDEEQ